jgi:hypothetical protein
MMSDNSLDIVLNWLSEDFEEIHTEITADTENARATEDKIATLESKVEALRTQTGVSKSSPTVALEPVPEIYEPDFTLSERSWNSIRREAEERLRERGIGPASVSLDDLLDPIEIKRIERRFGGGFSLETSLDQYDVLASIAAGLTAAIVDFLIVKIPKDIKYLGKIPQEGSPLTKWLHSLSVPDDNWLARYFKTSYDKVKGLSDSIEGFGVKTHRLQTFGHDPLLGLVVGTIDIMRGGLTAISKGGEIKFLSGTGSAHYNPFTAIVWQIMHLLSDIPTKMGIQPPGWTLLQLFQVGNFGDKDRTVADLARFMYLKGYDTRHFLTMSTSVAAAEVVLRGYFWIRRKLDEEYDEEVAHLGEVAGAEKTGEHPRFQGMAFAAHGIASAANAGKVAVYSGNPLAINYAQWLRFLHAMFKWTRTRLRSPSDVLMGHTRANLKALDQGWPEINVGDPSFPKLTV